MAALDSAGIGDRAERAMFLAQLAHESSGFTRRRESLHYRPERLYALFHRRVRSLQEARQVVAAGPEAIAERIYGGRADLGNTEPGDGARFIGRGNLQLTGRRNYESAGRALNLDLVGHPELAEDPACALRIAIWFWQTRHVGPAARRGDVGEATRRINGGENGLADRRVRFERYLELLGTEDRALQPSHPILPATPPASPANPPSAPAPEPTAIRLRLG